MTGLPARGADMTVTFEHCHMVLVFGKLDAIEHDTRLSDEKGYRGQT